MYSIFFRVGVTIGCLILIMFAMIRYVPAAPQEPLRAAMKATGAQLEEYSINAWMKLPDKQYSDVQLQVLVEEIMGQLAVDRESYEVIHQQRNKHRIVKAEDSSSDKHVIVMAQVVPSQVNESKEEAYLVINLESLVGGDVTIIPFQEKIKRILEKNGDSPRISTCLIGRLDGKLMDGESKSMLKSAFSAIDGVIVDQLQQDQYVSVTGFSSAIQEYLQVGGKKININIAIRYSQYDNRTYVIIGSPIITREY